MKGEKRRGESGKKMWNRKGKVGREWKGESRRMGVRKVIKCR